MNISCPYVHPQFHNPNPNQIHLFPNTGEGHINPNPNCNRSPLTMHLTIYTQYQSILLHTKPLDPNQSKIFMSEVHPHSNWLKYVSVNHDSYV